MCFDSKLIANFQRCWPTRLVLPAESCSFPPTMRWRLNSTWQLCGEAGLVAHDVEIRKADLEDVFLDVMNKGHQSVAALEAQPS